MPDQIMKRIIAPHRSGSFTDPDALLLAGTSRRRAAWRGRAANPREQTVCSRPHERAWRAAARGNAALEQPLASGFPG
jgi:hypothetical protein